MHVDGEKVVAATPTCASSTDEQFPFALHYFTGSKEHNIRLRQRAIDRGLKLNEYALAGDEEVDRRARTEADIFEALGLDYVPPELREDTGEIEAAEAKQAADAGRGEGHPRRLPQPHDRTATAPRRSRRWPLAAKELGLRVPRHRRPLAVADHRQRPVAGPRSSKQWAEIDALNAKLKGIRIFKGTECDILADGSLDFDDDLLAGVRLRRRQRPHATSTMPEEEMTARIVQGAVAPAVTMLGHATGRLLLRRDGYKVDLDAVLQGGREARQDDRDQRPAARGSTSTGSTASGRRRWASRSSSTRTPTAPASWRSTATAWTSPAAAG